MGLLGKLKIKKDDKDGVADNKFLETNKEKDEATKESKPKTASNTTKKTKGSSVGKFGTVLVRPVISEKAAVAEAAGAYTFVVKNNASKVDIKNAIKEVYNVKPKKVSVMNMDGKIKRSGRSRGRRSDWKKAIITLPKGQTISIHEGV